MNKGIFCVLSLLVLSFIFSGIWGCSPSRYGCPTNSRFRGYSENKILRSTTDERGLTTIEYIQNGQTWALDYLSPKQLDSVASTLSLPYVAYFKSGDTLDCRIVRDAEGLNKVAALWEQGCWDATERQIDSVFKLYCSPIK